MSAVSLSLNVPAASAAEATEELGRAIRARDSLHFESALLAGADVRATNGIGSNSLHDAVIFWGDLAAIERLLAMGADINATNSAGETALMLSLRHVQYSGDVTRVGQVVGLLLQRGSRIDVADAKGSTPAAAALALGSVPLLQAVLRAGGKLPPDSLMNALASDAKMGIITCLLEHAKNLDLTLRNASGQTVVHRAAESEEHVFLLRWLAEHGANLDVRDGRGRTALAEAALAENVAGMAYLFSRGLKLDSVDHDDAQAVHLAAHGGRYSPLQWLVERGADLQARDRWGRRALDIAIDSHRFAYASDADRLALAILLGGDSADIGRGRFNNHPLHMAIWAEDLRVVEALLSGGANPNVKDESGNTPLRRAINLASGGPATAAQIAFGRKLLPLLLQHGADTSLRMPVTMDTYDELARQSRYGAELARLKMRYAR